MRQTTIFLLALMVGGGLAAETEPLSIEIASQPLSRALEVFAEQSGLQVVYVSEIAAGVDTPGFSGSATVEEAMTALLDGTELTWTFANERTISLAPAPEEEPTEYHSSAESEEDTEGVSEADE